MINKIATKATSQSNKKKEISMHIDTSEIISSRNKYFRQEK